MPNEVDKKGSNMPNEVDEFGIPHVQNISDRAAALDEAEARLTAQLETVRARKAKVQARLNPAGSDMSSYQLAPKEPSPHEKFRAATSRFAPDELALIEQNSRNPDGTIDRNKVAAEMLRREDLARSRGDTVPQGTSVDQGRVDAMAQYEQDMASWRAASPEYWKQPGSREAAPPDRGLSNLPPPADFQPHEQSTEEKWWDALNRYERNYE